MTTSVINATYKPRIRTSAGLMRSLKRASSVRGIDCQGRDSKPRRPNAHHELQIRPPANNLSSYRPPRGIKESKVEIVTVSNRLCKLHDLLN